MRRCSAPARHFKGLLKTTEGNPLSSLSSKSHEKGPKHPTFGTLAGEGDDKVRQSSPAQNRGVDPISLSGHRQQQIF
jgi:hypothetical protein